MQFREVETLVFYLIESLFFEGVVCSSSAQDCIARLGADVRSYSSNIMHVSPVSDTAEKDQLLVFLVFWLVVCWLVGWVWCSSSVLVSLFSSVPVHAY